MHYRRRSLLTIPLGILLVWLIISVKPVDRLLAQTGTDTLVPDPNPTDVLVSPTVEATISQAGEPTPAPPSNQSGGVGECITSVWEFVQCVTTIESILSFLGVGGGIVAWVRHKRRKLTILGRLAQPIMDSLLFIVESERRRKRIENGFFSLDIAENRYEPSERVVDRYEADDKEGNKKIDSLLNYMEEENARILLLGEPGAGKSSCLLDLCHKLSQPWHSKQINLASRLLHPIQNLWQPPIDDKQDERPVFPFYIQLRHWNEEDNDISDFLGKYVRKLQPAKLSQSTQGGEEVDEITDFMLQLLVAESPLKPLILFDGFDEINTAEKRDAFLEALRNFVAAYRHVPFIMTSRLSEYTDSFESVSLSVLKILPFSKVTIGKYVTHYFGDDVTSRTTFLDGLARSKRAEALATTPLLLYWMCFNFAQEVSDGREATLPIHKTYLLSKCAEYVIGNYTSRRLKGKREVNEEDSEKILEVLGYRLQVQKVASVNLRGATNWVSSLTIGDSGGRKPSQDNLKWIADHVGLIERFPKGGRRLQFTHNLLQVYFAASYVSTHHDVLSDIREERWQDVVVMVPWLVRQWSPREAVAVARQLMPETVSAEMYGQMIVALRAFMEGFGDHSYFSDDARASINDELTLLQTDLQEQLQQFLRIVDLWNKEVWPEFIHIGRFLETLETDEEWNQFILSIWDEEDSSYWRKRAQLLGRLQDKRAASLLAVPQLILYEDAETKEAIHTALKTLGNHSVDVLLENCLAREGESAELYHITLKLLSRSSRTSVSIVEQVTAWLTEQERADKFDIFQADASQAVAAQGRNATSHLNKIIEPEQATFSMRRWAIRTYGRMPDSDLLAVAMPYILRMLRREQHGLPYTWQNGDEPFWATLQREAAITLDLIGKPAIDFLERELNGPDYNVAERKEVAFALRYISGIYQPRIISILIKLLNDEEQSVRRVARHSLIDIGVNTCTPLRQAIQQTQDTRHRQEISWVLQEINCPSSEPDEVS